MIKWSALAAAGALLAACGSHDDSAGSSAQSTPLGLSLVAGNAGGAGWADGTGPVARFNQPYASAVDTAGNLYVADSGNNVIRKVAPTGEVSTLAGQAGVCGHADGQGSAATFCGPQGITLAPNGNLYVADTQSGAIRMVTPAGVVSTLATVASPQAVVVDQSGNLYVLAAGGVIDKISQVGAVSAYAQPSTGYVTVAGSSAAVVPMAGVSHALLIADAGGGGGIPRGNGPETLTPDVPRLTLGGTQAPAPSGITSYPQGLGIDGSGRLYVTFAGTVYRIDAPGVTTTLATLTAAHYANAFTVDAGGTFYVEDIDTGNVIAVTASGSVSPLPCVAGSGDVCTANSIAINDGVFYIVDANNTIRRLPVGGAPVVLAGSANGSTVGASFNNPMGLAVDSAGNRYVADYGNDTVRKITPAGVVNTLAGQTGVAGYADGAGSAALFSGPSAVAVDGSGNVFVIDSGNNMIRKITPVGVVSTLAGSTTMGYADGTGSAAGFNFAAGPINSYYNSIGSSPSGYILLLILGLPYHFNFLPPVGLAIDGSGNLYVPDTYNSAIRVVTPQGVVTTLAGRSRGSYPSVVPLSIYIPEPDVDGMGASAEFSGPSGIVRAANGNFYVSDYVGNSIRQVTPTGVVTTIASSGKTALSTFFGTTFITSLNANAGLSAPQGIALDTSGNILIADSGNSVIRTLTPQGVISAAVGSGSYSGVVLGATNPQPGSVVGLLSNGGGLDLTSGNSVLHYTHP